ncbi:MAG: hypothetical protein HW397_384, partial [Dehalococcoidia bacterium]|nr:hypothetical protein [Dehalococcoidia bacterium]
MNSAEENIKERIRNEGWITFAEFMKLALYGPGGYYTQGQPIGSGGDYYTSPVAHSAFGALIVLQLEQMWALMGGPEAFQVVEMGAGDGVLASDILAYALHLDPGFYRALTYTAVDVNPRPNSSVSSEKLQWMKSATLPIRGINGCVISNELVDSLPVHRVRVRNGKLEELYLLVDHDAITEVWNSPSTPALAQRLADDEGTLAEGWEGEIGLSAASWMAQVGQALTRGYALTVDYGDTVERLYTSERSRGTVTSYFRHTQQA